MKELITRKKSLRISQTIYATTSIIRILIAALMSIALIVLTIIATEKFLSERTPYGMFLYITSIVLSLIIGGIIAFKWEIYGWPRKIYNTFFIVFLPVLTMGMVECLNNVFIVNWSARAIIINVVIYSFIYIAIYALTGSRRLPFVITTPIYFIISLVNYFVFAFRGTPFTPFDLMATQTAATVMGSYKFELGYQIIVALILAVFICATAWQITSAEKSTKKIITRVLVGLVPLVFFGSYYTSDAIANIGFSPDFFDQTRGYRETGVIPSFLFNTKYLTMKEPQGYNAADIEKIVKETLKETDQTENNENKTPNLICIMNESLTDYSLVGDLQTNKDCLPYIHSLSENTIKGNLYVPVIGAGTSNTEFEFLTGTSTAFMPKGSNAYTLYVKNQIPTLTNTLEVQGYSSIAFHPFFENNWNRVNVYNYMGFDRYDGMEAFFNNDIMSAYKNGSTYEGLKNLVKDQFGENNNVLLRDIVSDKFNYDKVIEMYEGRDTEKPFYIFNVTMQNHGGYQDPFYDFNEEIYLVDENGNKRTEYPLTNQFLSLMYESDKAFKELVDYFEKQDEPTVILMFGDHQPKIEDEFIEELLGANGIHNLTLEQTQARYQTPFYIWANYDIEEKEIDKLSVNYLSSYLLKISGMEMSSFNRYLLELSDVLPVIDTVGYIDANDNYYTYGVDSKYSSLISGYEKICYNYLFDTKNRATWLYD